MILVDSSGWIEYLLDRPLAPAVAPYLEGRERSIISAIQVYEVYRVFRRDLAEERAVEAVSALRKAEVVAVDESLALEAADVSLRYKLAMADSIVYATASARGAKIITLDADFDGLPHAVVLR